MNFKCTILLSFIALGLWISAPELTHGSGLEAGEYKNHTARQRACQENQQYLHQGQCCLNCKAGTYVKTPCDNDLQQGTCANCEYGKTYTEHSNGMVRCLQCTQCRNDQTQTVACTITRDTQCQCKVGLYCEPEQACEVCKRCAKCKLEEEVQKNCTFISNTECVKRSIPFPPPPSTDTTQTAILIGTIVPTLIILTVLIYLIVWCQKKRKMSKMPEISDSADEVSIPIREICSTMEELQNTVNAGRDIDKDLPELSPLLQETQGVVTKAQPVEDEDKGLGDSLPNTTNSSQTSLSALPHLAFLYSSPHSSPVAPRQVPGTGDSLQRRLEPLLGEENSLRKSFDLFDEFLDVRIHNKFFRCIGVSDNAIKMNESPPNVDKVYELLKSWMQKEGLKANINYLLQALLSLDQRRSAESIASKAIEKGYYKYSNKQ